MERADTRSAPGQVDTGPDHRNEPGAGPYAFAPNQPRSQDAGHLDFGTPGGGDDNA
jgi:hypothetical protein